MRSCTLLSPAHTGVCTPPRPRAGHLHSACSPDSKRGARVSVASVVVPFQHSLSSANNWLFFLRSAICACFRSIKCLLVSFLLMRVCCSVFFLCLREETQRVSSYGVFPELCTGSGSKRTLSGLNEACRQLFLCSDPHNPHNGGVLQL